MTLREAVIAFDQEMIDQGFWAELDMQRHMWFNKYWGFVLDALQAEDPNRLTNKD